MVLNWCLIFQEGLNCRLAERDTFIITIVQNAMMEGRIRKTTFQGESTVESLDPDTVHKLLHYLDLTNQVTSQPERQLHRCFCSPYSRATVQIVPRRKGSPCWL